MTKWWQLKPGPERERAKRDDAERLSEPTPPPPPPIIKRTGRGDGYSRPAVRDDGTRGWIGASGIFHSAETEPENILARLAARTNLPALPASLKVSAVCERLALIGPSGREYPLVDQTVEAYRLSRRLATNLENKA